MRPIKLLAFLLTLVVDSVGQKCTAASDVASFPVAGGCYSLAAYGADPTGATASDAALNSMLVAIGEKSGCIDFGPGLFKFLGPITVVQSTNALQQITVRGRGAGVTRLYWPGGQGIAVAVGDGHNQVHFSGLTLLTGSASSGDAIAVTGSGAPVSNAKNTFDDITCEGFDYYNGTGQTSYWAHCLRPTLLSNVSYRDILVYGSGLNQGVGVAPAGSTGNYSIVHDISDSAFFNTSVGFLYDTYLQGVTISRVQFTNGATGISAPATSSGAYQLNVTDSQFNVSGQAIDIEADITAVSLKGNLFLIPSGKCAVVIGGGRSFIVGSGNSFIPLGGSTATSGTCVNLNDGVGANVITGNAYGSTTGTALSFGNQLQSGSNNWNVQSNAYNNVTMPNVNVGNGNVIGGGSP